MLRTTILSAALILVTAGAQAQQSTNANQQSSATAAIVNNTPGGGGNLGETVPPVYAPGLDSGTNDCAVSASGGASGSGFGISFGASTESEDCQHRNWFVLMSRAGQSDVARLIACHNEAVRRAYKLAGKPCPEEIAEAADDAGPHGNRFLPGSER
jgi:hypothetical protein